MNGYDVLGMMLTALCVAALMVLRLHRRWVKGNDGLFDYLLAVGGGYIGCFVFLLLRVLYHATK